MARLRAPTRCSTATASPGALNYSKGPAMSETPPDRLSNDPDSPFYDEALLARGIGVRFAGQEKTNVEEYCISEGWIRVAAGKALDRKGKPLTIKLKGPVEAYFREGT